MIDRSSNVAFQQLWETLNPSQRQAFRAERGPGLWERGAWKTIDTCVILCWYADVIFCCNDALAGLLCFCFFQYGTFCWVLEQGEVLPLYVKPGSFEPPPAAQVAVAGRMVKSRSTPHMESTSPHGAGSNRGKLGGGKPASSTHSCPLFQAEMEIGRERESSKITEHR